MTIPTEPIGSIPRPLRLVEAVLAGDGTDLRLDPLYEEAIRDTIERFEATGSPVITDGEQRKYHNFWTYCVHGLPNTAPDGFKIPFSAGHVRRMLRLTGGPFRYKRHADSYLDVALKYAHKPVKQAVISPSALSLMYPADEIPGYPREQFIDDLLKEHETEVRACLQKGAHKVQIDFTEGRLAVKIDPSGHLLNSFIDLNNLALARFSAEDRQRIGVHTCPGSDRDSTHSGDADYAELLPSLFQLKAGNFYVALAGERDRVCVLKIIREHMKPDHRVFVSVINPIDPRVETPEEVRGRYGLWGSIRFPRRGFHPRREAREPLTPRTSLSKRRRPSPQSDPIAKGQRVMQRVTVSAGVLVCVGLVCAQAAAQDIPEETRKGLAEQLHGSFVVFRAKVQEDLKLTNEQKEKLEQHLKELHPDLMQLFQKLDGLKGQEREKELRAYRPKAQEKLAAFLKETLKDDQRKRLRQLELQREGALALWHGDVEIGKNLKITDEQRKQFMAVVQDMQKKIAPLIKEAQSGGNAEEIRPKMMKIRKEHEGKIEALLTDAQKKQWKEMLGKPLDLGE